MRIAFASNGGSLANILENMYEDVGAGMVQLCKAHGILRDVANELTTWTDRAGHNAV